MLTQSQIKYNKLMEKSEELFIQLGYKSVSMDQIAEAAGISKMTIYKYFSSKEELFLEVLQIVMDKSYEYLQNEINKVEGTLEKINAMLTFNIEYSQQYSLAFYKDIMSDPNIYNKIMEEKKKMTSTVFEDIIKSGMEKGDIRKVDEAFISNILIALVDGLGNGYFKEVTNKEDIEDFAEKFYDFLKYGLLGGKSQNNG